MSKVDINLKKDYIKNIFLEEANNRNTLHMTANENVISKTAKLFLSSDLSFRYYSDTYEKDGSLSELKYYLFGGAMYRGLPAVYKLEQIAQESANSMFSAGFTNFLPLSGMHAVISVLLTMTKVNSKICIFPPGSLRHHATASIIESVGRKVVYIPWSERDLNIDLEKFVKTFKEEKPDVIFLDLGTAFYPLPIREIRKVVGKNTLIIYDGSHVLGLIAGQKFQNPLKEGCDVLIGNTHKTFPGPQKGMLIFKNAEIGRKVSQVMLNSVVSSQHTHHAISLYITILEMECYGQSYASQIIKNSNALFKALSEWGFKMVSRDNELPISHMIAIKGDFPDGNHHACAALQECNISTNSKKIFGIDVLRLGVQEITRRGMKEEEMKQIAYFFKEIILNKNMSIAKTIHEFNKKFDKVKYSFDDHDS
jgi:glycine hydroxymethyltransferase